MPRSKKTVYERIEDKRNELKAANKVIEELTATLKQLEEERDNQEMQILFKTMKRNNIDFNQAIKMMEKTK